jgi:uncharacterized membrane protein YvlD (DUF360 family)
MKKQPGSRWLLILLCCILAVPTVGVLMGLVPPDVNPEAVKPALLVGTLLGLAHILLRPVLRLLFAPVGCLTLGLFGLAIDIGLIYLCASCVEGFYVPSFLYALLTALLINGINAVAAGRR